MKINLSREIIDEIAEMVKHLPLGERGMVSIQMIQIALKEEGEEECGI